MRRTLWINCLILVFGALAWGGYVAFTGPRLTSGTASVRYSNQSGRCRIEAAYGDLFTLIGTDSEGERRIPSRLNILLLKHTVELEIDSTLKAKWT